MRADAVFLRRDAKQIIRHSIEAVLPEAAVRTALADFVPPKGKTVLVAAGKAAWRMAKAAASRVRVDAGLVVTKYGHSMGDIPGFEILEAGHPLPDEGSVRGALQALELVQPLGAEDAVLFLLSGGASAIFEAPAIPLEELADITGQLLKRGADIVEMNTIRKRLSLVKGGRFAAACAPAQVFSIVLSDVLGDNLSAIGSGPTAPDPTTCEAALEIAEKYALALSDGARACLETETPKVLANSAHRITGSVRALAAAAAEAAKALGYKAVVETTDLACEARDAGAALARRARALSGQEKTALIWGGETVVHVTGTGLGGRNQELALAAALELEGSEGICIFSLGSDGTDGPTDAAGGIADGSTAAAIRAAGIDPAAALENNDAYHALQAADALLLTGPTGTNVNDISVALIG